jgi:hypothetical protein
MHFHRDQHGFHASQGAAVQYRKAHKRLSKFKISSPYGVALKKTCLHITQYAALRFFSRAWPGLKI